MQVSKGAEAAIKPQPQDTKVCMCVVVVGGTRCNCLFHLPAPPPPSKMLGLPLVSRPEAEVPCARVRVGIPLATTTSAPRNPFAGLKHLHLFFPRND